MISNNSLCTNMLMLYLGVILCNCKFLLSEKVLEKLRTNRKIQHIIAFISVFIFILITDKKPPKENFIKALLIYIWFILITKVNIYFHFIIVILLVLCATQEKNNEINKKKPKHFITKLLSNNIFYLIAIIIFTLIGNFYYYNQNKIQHALSFDVFKFLFCGKETS